MGAFSFSDAACGLAPTPNCFQITAMSRARAASSMLLKQPRLLETRRAEPAAQWDTWEAHSAGSSTANLQRAAALAPQHQGCQRCAAAVCWPGSLERRCCSSRLTHMPACQPRSRRVMPTSSCLGRAAVAARPSEVLGASTRSAAAAAAAVGGAVAVGATLTGEGWSTVAGAAAAAAAAVACPHVAAATAALRCVSRVVASLRSSPVTARPASSWRRSRKLGHSFS